MLLSRVVGDERLEASARLHARPVPVMPLHVVLGFFESLRPSLAASGVLFEACMVVIERDGDEEKIASTYRSIDLRRSID